MTLLLHNKAAHQESYICKAIELWDFSLPFCFIVILARANKIILSFCLLGKIKLSSFAFLCYPILLTLHDVISMLATVKKCTATHDATVCNNKDQ